MEPFAGTVWLFAFDYVPAGWAACDGSLLPIASNTVLYSLLGNSYGGQAPQSFALPNLPPVEAANGAKLQYCIALFGELPPRP